MHENAREALAKAHRTMTAGAFDNGHPEGAAVNAWESIAWSLIGLLGTAVDAPKEGLSAGLQGAGFLRMDDQR